MKHLVDANIACDNCRHFVEEGLLCKKDYEVCEGRECPDFQPKIVAVTDERIPRFMDLMIEKHNWEFTESEAEDVLTIVDQIRREMLFGKKEASTKEPLQLKEPIQFELKEEAS